MPQIGDFHLRHLPAKQRHGQFTEAATPADALLICGICGFFSLVAFPLGVVGLRGWVIARPQDGVMQRGDVYFAGIKGHPNFGPVQVGDCTLNTVQIAQSSLDPGRAMRIIEPFDGDNGIFQNGLVGGDRGVWVSGILL
jgi:hypothetical protein